MTVLDDIKNYVKMGREHAFLGQYLESSNYFKNAIKCI
jgi:hypothetical protein